jgi:hypothetical protein
VRNVLQTNEEMSPKGNEEELTEQELRFRLKEIRLWEQDVLNYKYDQYASPAKRGGVEQLLSYFYLIRMISDAVLRIKIYERTAKGLPEDIEELSRQVRWLNNFQYPFAETKFYGLRGYGRDELLRKIEKCREEILKEQVLYEDLLTEFGMKPFSPLRPRNKFAKATKRGVFKSRWKQMIFLALNQLGLRAHYLLVAHWIADNFPNAQLPSYCKKFKDLSRDIGWLAANYKEVAKGVMRDVSRVRIAMANNK